MAKKKKFTGLEPNAPTCVNKRGGRQSVLDYRCDLFDPVAMLHICRVLNRGAIKYGDDNWRIISVEENLNHALSHIYAHLSGDRGDDHLGHAACRIVFALAKHDRPTYLGNLAVKRKDK